MKYLVTGASGDLGSQVIDYLLKEVDAKNIAALVRNPKKAGPLEDKGVDVRIANYKDKEALIEAFEGVTHLLFISSVPGEEYSREKQHENVVEAAKESGAEYIAYTSLTNAQESGSALAPDHVKTENLIKESGMSYSFLRNNWYLENLAPLFQLAKEQGKYPFIENGHSAGWAPKKDFAEAAARILVKGKEAKEVYELGGPLLSYDEIGQEIKQALFSDVELVGMKADQYKKYLTDELAVSEENAEFIVGTAHETVVKGVVEYESSDLETVLDRNITSIPDTIREIVK